MGLLKGEIKIYKEKHAQLLNFEGKISEFETFRTSLVKLLDGYKPK
jgi:hypothetical protein